MGDVSNIIIGWRSALMFAVCLPMAMVAIMLMLRRVERPANIFFGLFLFIAAWTQGPQIIGFSEFYTVWPGLTFFPFNAEFYVGPLLYLHAYKLMDGRALGWRKYLLIPGIVQTIYYCWAFVGLGGYQNKWAYNDAIHSPYIVPLETIIGLAMAIWALVTIALMIRKYSKFLENTQSAVKDFDPVWLKHLMASVIVVGILFAILELIPLIFGSISYVNAFPLEIIMTAIVAWLGFEALSRMNYAYPKMESPLPSTKEMPPTRIAQDDWQTKGVELRTSVINGGWFLEPRLSIRDLAQRMGSNETYISKALNKGLDSTFNNFINDLRIEHAQTMIVKGGTTILDIALSSGFNSKATFNRVFRDRTNLTPTQFKKSQIT